MAGSPVKVLKMALRDDSYAEVPRLCVPDARGVDPMLAKLRAVHGEAGRPDVAPEIARGAKEDWGR